MLSRLELCRTPALDPGQVLDWIAVRELPTDCMVTEDAHEVAELGLASRSERLKVSLRNRGLGSIPLSRTFLQSVQPFLNLRGFDGCQCLIAPTRFNPAVQIAFVTVTSGPGATIHA